MFISARVGNDVEVHYRWHALYGRRVPLHYSEARTGARLSYVEAVPGVVIVLPSWMLDAGAKGKPPIGSSASRRACRRQANTCCGVRPWRRAIWLTGAPSSKLSATIAAFCSAIQARRRPAPVKISSRCAGRETFDTSLRSEIDTCRSPHTPRLSPSRPH